MPTMTTSERTALIRKASKRIESETSNLWELHPGLSKEIVKIVLAMLEEKAAA